jgi:5-oxoprolinase (ATP-hydrolysing)
MNKTVLKVLENQLPNTPISLSSEVLLEVMEYGRTVTTVANSYVKS